MDSSTERGDTCTKGGGTQVESEDAARLLPEETLWVRFVFVDHASIPKAKAVHRNSFVRRSKAGVGLIRGVLALNPDGQLHAASGLSPVGEVRLVPDLPASSSSRSPPARRWFPAT